MNRSINEYLNYENNLAHDCLAAMQPLMNVKRLNI